MNLGGCFSLLASLLLTVFILHQPNQLFHLMKLRSLTALLGAIALAGVSHGAEFSDQFSGSPLKSFNGWNSYSETFNFLDHGYNPADMIVIGATAWFSFADDSDNSQEWVDVTIGTTLVADNYEYDGTHNNAPNNYDKQTYVLNGYADLIADLQDGTIGFNVQSVGGDGYLKIAKLKIYTDTRPTTSVPDGGATAALLGLGLIGLAAVRNRIGSARRS